MKSAAEKDSRLDTVEQWRNKQRQIYDPCEKKVKRYEDLYSAPSWLVRTPEALRFGSHCSYPANTPYTCLCLVSVHQTAPQLRCSHLITAYYSLIDPVRMKGWVDLVSWPTADGLPIKMVTHQLKGRCRLGKEPDVLSLSYIAKLGIPERPKLKISRHFNYSFLFANHSSVSNNSG